MSEPWTLKDYSHRVLGHFARRETAQIFADKHDRRGWMTVANARTGETWRRRKGSWFKAEKDNGP